MSTKRRGPGLKGKKSIWYFDGRSQPTMKKVESMISGVMIRKFTLSRKKPHVNIAICNRGNITLRDLDEGLADVIMLNPLDFYKIFRWLKKGSLDFSKFRGCKIVFYNFPVRTELGSALRNPGNFYICLENDMVMERNWIFTVRAEEYLRAQGYKIACLLKS